MPKGDGIGDSKSIKNKIGLKIFAIIICYFCVRQLCGNYGYRAKLNIIKLHSVKTI